MNGTGRYVGIQSKAVHTLTVEMVDEERRKALTFSPKLHRYFVLTTADRDARIQTVLRNMAADWDVDFPVTVWFWNDIQSMLLEKRNLKVYQEFYPHHFHDHTSFGFGLSKLFSVSIRPVGTLCEFLLTEKFPKAKDGSMNYWRGLYFLTNLHCLRTCRLAPHINLQHELSVILDNEFDGLAVADWIASVGSLDEIMKTEQTQYVYSLTEEKQREFRDTIRRQSRNDGQDEPPDDDGSQNDEFHDDDYKSFEDLRLSKRARKS
jgi:hypothetical protein